MTYLPLEMRRGDDFALAIQLVVADTEAPIDLTSYIGRLVIRYAAGEAGSPLIAGANVVSATATGVSFFDPTEGWLQIQVTKEDLATIPGTMAIVRCAYNLRLTDTDGFEMTFLSGPLDILPEVYL